MAGDWTDVAHDDGWTDVALPPATGVDEAKGAVRGLVNGAVSAAGPWIADSAQAQSGAAGWLTRHLPNSALSALSGIDDFARAHVPEWVPNYIYDRDANVGAKAREAVKTGDASKLADVATNAVGNYSPAGVAAKVIPTTGQAEDWLQNKTGITLPTPETPTGQAVANVASFIPGALTGGGNMAANAVKFGLAPGLLSEGAGQAADYFAGPEAGEAARFVGGLAGPRAAHPNEGNRLQERSSDLAGQQHRDYVATLRANDVPVTAAEALNREKMKYIDSVVDPAQAERAHGAFTRAATDVIPGIDGTDVATHGAGGWLANANNEMGRRFDAFNQHDFNMDGQFGRDILDWHANTQRNPGLNPEAERSAQAIFDRLTSVLQNNNGNMPGADYRELRSQIAAEARGTQNPVREQYLIDANRHLDAAMARSIGRQGGDEAGFNRLNGDYRAFLTLQDALQKPNNPARRGYITPANLGASARKIYGANAYERGQTPFSQLGHAGEAVLQPLPQSGTDARNEARTAVAERLKFPLAIGSTLAGALHSGGVGGAEGGVLGLLLGEQAGRVAAPVGQLAYRAVRRNPVTESYIEGRGLANADTTNSLPGLLTAANAATNALRDRKRKDGK